MTASGCLTKSQKLSRAWEIDESELRPEYRSISCELRALTEMVRDELSNADPADPFFTNSGGASTVSVFERRRFYDVYCARRNERLKMKKGGGLGEEKTERWSDPHWPRLSSKLANLASPNFTGHGHARARLDLASSRLASLRLAGNRGAESWPSHGGRGKEDGAAAKGRRR
ncbi:uncharacterized protein J3R85_008962 [Psidium guajava]|nr:uncharacterized protein J3R85_008962 [Psidium guajava]